MKICNISEIQLKYKGQAWECTEFQEKFSGDIRISQCSSCTARVRQEKYEDDVRAKEEIDSAEYVNAESNPIVSNPYTVQTGPSDCSCLHKRGRWCGDDGKGNEKITGKWVFYPSSSKHFGGIKTGVDVDNLDQTISWFKRMDDDWCNFKIKYDFPNPDELHPELQK